MRWIFAALFVGWPVLCQAVSLQVDIPYGPGALQKLDLCRPAGPPVGSVIVIHGGGWASGDKADTRSACLRYAQNGVLALSVNYRLLDGHHASWPEPADDLLAVLRWMAEHEGELAVAGDGVCLHGVSAGGHLAAFLAARTAGISCAVIDFAPLDLGQPGFVNTVHRFFPNEAPAGFPATAKELSPASLVTPSSPPMFISHGQADRLIPISHAKALEAALVQAQVRVETRYFGGGHDWAGASAGEVEAIGAAELRFVKSNLGRRLVGASRVDGDER